MTRPPDLFGRIFRGTMALGLFLFFAYRAWFIKRDGIPLWLRWGLVITGSILILTLAESC